jgi:hypothetical protein
MQSTVCFTILTVIASSPVSDYDAIEHGDIITRIGVPDGFRASVFCAGISGVDGLVFSSGYLYAASESNGFVYRVDESGNPFLITDSLDHPEGLASDRSGSIYVTEDVENGRLLVIGPTGIADVLCDSLQYPEGVAWLEGGSIAVTESSLEATSLPPVLSGVRIISDNEISLVYSSMYLWSFSDIAADSTGLLYVCNELSGYGFITESIIRVNPVSGAWEVFCRGLHSCEGIGFSGNGCFPVFVAEEDTGSGSGRLSMVDEDGNTTTFAEGFLNIEDVAVGPNGEIYVSEDTSGMIILIERETDQAVDY